MYLSDRNTQNEKREAPAMKNSKRRKRRVDKDGVCHNARVASSNAQSMGALLQLCSES